MISAICVSCRDEVAKAIRRAIGDARRRNARRPPYGSSQRAK